MQISILENLCLARSSQRFYCRTKHF